MRKMRMMIKIPERVIKIINHRKYRSVFLIAVSLYTICGFLVLPLLMKPFLSGKLTEILGRPTSVREIRSNPFTLSVKVSGLHVSDHDGKTFAALETFFCDLSLLPSLLNRGPVIRRIQLESPFFRIVRTDERRFNFSDLTGEKEKEANDTGAPLPPFSLQDVGISGGRVILDDRFKNSRHEFSGVDLALPFLSSLPADRQERSKLSLGLNIDGAKIRLGISAHPFDKPVEARISATIEDLDLPLYRAYLPLPAGLVLSSGSLTLDTNLTVSGKENNAPAVTDISGTLSLNAWEVRAAEMEPLFKLPYLSATLLPSDPAAQAYHLGTVRIEAPFIHIDRLADETTNLSVIAASLAGNGKGPEENEAVVAGGNGTAPSPSVTLEHLELAGGSVRFTDRSLPTPFSERINGINIRLKHFSTQPGAKTDFSLAAHTEGVKEIDISGSLTATPPSSEGTFEIKGIHPERYAPYYENLTGVSASGAMDLGAAYHFSKDGPSNIARLTGASLALSDLTLKERKNGEMLLTIPTFSVTGSDLDLAEKRISLGRVSSENGEIRLVRSGDGTFNIPRALAPPPVRGPVPASTGGEPAPTRPEPAALSQPIERPWTAGVDHLTLSGYTVKWRDEILAHPAAITLDRIDLSAESLSTEAPGHLSLALRWNAAGAIALQGPLSLDPPSASWDIRVERLPIASLQPYFNDRLQLMVTDGDFNAGGKLNVTRPATGAPSVRFRGKAAINRFASVDRLMAQDFLKWDSLNLTGIDFDAVPAAITIDEIALSDFYSRLIVNPDGSVNVRNVLSGGPSEPSVSQQTESSAVRKATGSPEDTRETASQALTADAKKHTKELRKGSATAEPADSEGDEGMALKIGAVSLQNGTINFSDNLAKPKFDAVLKEIGGRVSGLSSQAGTRADVQLSGIHSNGASLAIRGNINPLSRSRYLDLHFTFGGIELPPFSPYTARYLGYPLEKGKLNLNLHYTLDGNSIVGKNHVFFDQFTLGQRLDSPDATGLPVKLGLSLLTDRKGHIKFDLPVKGDLSDPEFSFAGLIFKGLASLITKIATSPFTAIGAIFGSGADLSVLDFAYGGAEITAEMDKRLETLAAALYDRPKLSLEIRGMADGAKDREAIIRRRFEDLLSARKLEAAIRSGKTPPANGRVTILPGEYEAMLESAYVVSDIPKAPNDSKEGKALTAKEMENALLAHIEVTDGDLRQLAHHRSAAVKERLLRGGKLTPDRLFILEPGGDFSAAGDKEDRNRVVFSMK